MTGTTRLEKALWVLAVLAFATAIAMATLYGNAKVDGHAQSHQATANLTLVP